MITLDAKTAQGKVDELTKALGAKQEEVMKAREVLLLLAEESRAIELKLHAYEAMVKELAE